MIGWLLKQLAIPLVAPALLAAFLASTGGLGLTWWHLHQANATITENDKTIASLKSDLEHQKTLTAETEKALSDFHAQVETDRANTNANTLAEHQRMQAQIDDLASQRNRADRARKAASDDLLKALHAIPIEQQNVVSAGVRDALRRVRDDQGFAPDVGATAPTGGGQDGNRVPGAAARGGPDMPP